ncbi:hypothetical protein [Tenacibaculum maritimum]|uniref:HEAT repeat domain-containing protein n=1 Tax=Tenacibaculum maritimum NCIMB 2154 TaxID=1349785 RepID=A0A2H1ECV7_9FLAO|nr:hypothetical protein [Tenacibaculum maritimum]MCD9564162.1 hypothetical protein [Tenacibaculum maritimum]MCD9567101.1 hypothetical protein [Tenacibaculum maritimum]MCD9577714.1 hypothetical protein [Tenacibaculum maritimum]MCD9597888.1 hypothetical protein [Tenacibaculum maritimum]MCD9613495.1 hypothetical protein [Tenacibaculum maritimum]
MKHEDFEKIILEENKDKILDSLLYVTEYDDDWEWVENKCLELINSKDNDIKGLAITCLGHLARIHGKINYKKVSKILESNLSDLTIKGRIEDAFDDIKMFTENE